MFTTCFRWCAFHHTRRTLQEKECMCNILAYLLHLSIQRKRSCNILYFVHSYVHVYNICLKMILTPMELVAQEVVAQEFLAVLRDFFSETSFWWWFFFTLIWGLHLSSIWPAKQIRINFVHFEMKTWIKYLLLLSTDQYDFKPSPPFSILNFLCYCLDIWCKFFIT